MIHSFDSFEMGIFSKKKVDPCEKYLKDYLDCVGLHTRGLSEGDECKIGEPRGRLDSAVPCSYANESATPPYTEADVYKKCRADNKARTKTK